jgi:drug/metabolite transporter (DMT)-like permease
MRAEGGQMVFEWRGLLLAFIATIVGVSADALLKVASAERTPFWNRWFLAGCVLTGGFVVVWVLLMQTMKIATAGVFYAATSALLLVVIGTMFFGERLTPGETTGVVMAACAVVLLGRVA